MTGLPFLDTNVLVYATLQPDARSDTARRLLANRGVISVQVLNEFANVARRRLNRSWPEIANAVDAVCVLCPAPRPITLDLHVAARGIAEQTGYQFYDALIIATALDAGCATLLSEDMQDGQVIDRRLTIRNPFVAAGD